MTRVRPCRRVLGPGPRGGALSAGVEVAEARDSGSLGVVGVARGVTWAVVRRWRWRWFDAGPGAEVSSAEIWSAAAARPGGVGRNSAPARRIGQ